MAERDPGLLYAVTVEGVGPFTFTRRTIRHQVAVEVEYCRQTEGLAVVTDFLAKLAGAIADLKVLTVSTPEGWTLEEADALDEDTFERIFKVWEALREKERTFRPGLQQANPQGGAGANP